MAQTWKNLLFAHWPVDPDVVRPHVPDGLVLDTRDGSAWIGVTPFVLAGLRIHGLPPLPSVSTFPELNVRTYVTHGGKGGILFFSLDAASTGAVAAARRLYRLPYFRARMRARIGPDESVAYESTRVDPRGEPAELRAAYRPLGPVFNAEPGSLEAFLAERYCLYTDDGAGGLLRADIHHPPWPLQRASAEIETNTMPPSSIPLPEQEPLLHFAARQDVVIWRPRRPD
jgi:uncharacterized protein YqjF (DUF2071 family)